MSAPDYRLCRTSPAVPATRGRRRMRIAFFLTPARGRDGWAIACRVTLDCVVPQIRWRAPDVGEITRVYWRSLASTTRGT
jgi:hypothetical protein